MPPSFPLLSYVATITLSLCVGYFAGIGFALPISKFSEENGALDDELNLDVETEEPMRDNGGSGILKARYQGEYSLGSPVLVVRDDLGMSSGKIAAQCSHATLACYNALKLTKPSLLSHWERTGQKKIALLSCEDEEELLLLQAQAQSLDLCACAIQDAGRTQVAAGSRTVVGIGPGPVQLLDQVTGKLSLLL